MPFCSSLLVMISLSRPHSLAWVDRVWENSGLGRCAVEFESLFPLDQEVSFDVDWHHQPNTISEDSCDVTTMRPSTLLESHVRERPVGLSTQQTGFICKQLGRSVSFIF